MRRLVLAAWGLVGTLGAVWAGPLEDGVAAYQRYNFAEALKSIAPLAEEGNPRAQGLLGKMYVNGHGVPLSSIRAVRWLRLAAQKGDADAQDQLALLYFRGKGVPLDLEEAAKWFTLAAEQGHANAQQCLAGLYTRGDGVPQSHARAHLWYSLAERNGLAASRASRVAIETLMTPAQLDKAKELLAKCDLSKRGCDSRSDQASR
jgi:TPR repeat protein